MTLVSKNNSKIALSIRAVDRKLFHLYKTFKAACFPQQFPRAVFLIGSGRSGTDILAFSLSNSADVLLVNEDNPLAFDNWRLKDLGMVNQSIKQSGYRYVLLKPIVETLRAKELLDTFENSLCIFQTRHPFDAINSMIRFFGEGHVRAVKNWVDTDFEMFPQLPKNERDYVREYCTADLSLADASALYWIVYNNAYFYLGLNSDNRVKLVSYENLVQQADETIASACAFLGIEPRNRMTREIYSSSIGRNNPPSINVDLEQRCEEIWNKLQDQSQKSG